MEVIHKAIVKDNRHAYTFMDRMKQISSHGSHTLSYCKKQQACIYIHGSYEKNI